MVKHRFDIAEPYSFNMIAWNLPILKFVLSEFSIPNKSIEEGILYRGVFVWEPLHLKSLKICFDHGYTPTEYGLKALLFFVAESHDANVAAFLLEKYNINLNQGLGHNPYRAHNALYFGYSTSAPLTFAAHWLAYGVCHAASNKFFKLAKVLLEHGADVNYASPDSGITPLMCALRGRGGDGRLHHAELESKGEKTGHRLYPGRCGLGQAAGRPSDGESGGEKDPHHGQSRYPLGQKGGLPSSV